MSDTSLSDLHGAFVTLHEEVREVGSEFDFRYSLVDHRPSEGICRKRVPTQAMKPVHP